MEEKQKEEEQEEGSQFAPVHFGANPHCVNT